jgi:hypothetical protein
MHSATPNLEDEAMNKAQARQVAMIEVYLANGMTDTAALSLSALIRSAMTNKSAQELRQLAEQYQLTAHPKFRA